MIATLVTLELRTIELLSREQLITLLLGMGNCLPRPYSRERLETQPTEHLQILLLAAKLFDVIVRQDSRGQMGGEGKNEEVAQDLLRREQQGRSARPRPEQPRS
jgi:hypothetical protein